MPKIATGDGGRVSHPTTEHESKELSVTGFNTPLSSFVSFLELEDDTEYMTLPFSLRSLRAHPDQGKRITTIMIIPLIKDEMGVLLR